MRQAEGLTSHHAPVRKERGVRYCNNETVSDMGLERPQSVTERACCAGYVESWEGRYASQRASGGASGAWIGQARERKGRLPLVTAAIRLGFQYMGRQMGKRPRQNFPKIKFHISDGRPHFFPPRNFLKCHATPLLHSCHSVTILPQHG